MYQIRLYHYGKVVKTEQFETACCMYVCLLSPKRCGGTANDTMVSGIAKVMKKMFVNEEEE